MYVILLWGPIHYLQIMNYQLFLQSLFICSVVSQTLPGHYHSSSIAIINLWTAGLLAIGVWQISHRFPIILL